MSAVTVRVDGEAHACVPESCYLGHAQLDELLAIWLLENDMVGLGEPRYSVHFDIGRCMDMHRATLLYVTREHLEAALA